MATLNPTRLTTYDAVVQFLYQRVDYERGQAALYSSDAAKLDRMRELAARVGNPHDRFSIVHVAGTKGKGSTSAMIAAILTQAGYRTGLFTSPHLERLEERLAIDGGSCPPDDLIELANRVKPHVEAMDRQAEAVGQTGPTYFEITTAMALLYFLDRKVAAAVLEVGLGGRLDSTNICLPRVAVITSISLDHTRQLGDSLEAIAREKAGIIKPQVPVVSGVTNNGPRAVVRQVCHELQAPLDELGRDFDFTYAPPRHLEQSAAAGRIGVAGCSNPPLPSHAGCFNYAGLDLPLLGRHQAANAAVALAAVNRLQRQGWHVGEAAVRQGLAHLNWPARIELVRRRPATVIDAAHNVASIEALLAAIDESFQVRRRRLLFATSRDKDARGMLARLLQRFDDVVLTRYSNNTRAVEPQELAQVARELTGREYPVYADSSQAWDALSDRTEPDDLLCVTGSFFLAAEIRRRFR